MHSHHEDLRAQVAVRLETGARASISATRRPSHLTLEPGLPPDRAPVTPDAVRQAYKCLHRAARLERVALFERFGDRLAPLLCEVVETLRRNPVDHELGELLRVTYIQPRHKQRVAAMDLDLPWGTYRHRLRRALELASETITRL